VIVLRKGDSNDVACCQVSCCSVRNGWLGGFFAGKKKKKTLSNLRAVWNQPVSKMSVKEIRGKVVRFIQSNLHVTIQYQETTKEGGRRDAIIHFHHCTHFFPRGSFVCMYLNQKRFVPFA